MIFYYFLDIIVNIIFWNRDLVRYVILDFWFNYYVIKIFRIIEEVHFIFGLYLLELNGFYLGRNRRGILRNINRECCILRREELKLRCLRMLKLKLYQWTSIWRRGVALRNCRWLCCSRRSRWPRGGSRICNYRCRECGRFGRRCIRRSWRGL